MPKERKPVIVIPDSSVAITIMILKTKAPVIAILVCLVVIITIHPVDVMLPLAFMEVIIAPRYGCLEDIEITT